MPLSLGEGTEALLYFLAIVLSVDLFLLVRLYVPLVRNARRPIPLGAGSRPFVSVILRSRGDAERLQQALEPLLAQDYRHYEVVVVDDSRDEECGYLLERLRRQHAHLKVTVAATDHKFMTPENLAFTVGAKAARGEWLLFTESTASPRGQSWVGGMALRMVDSVDVLLGYGAYAASGSSLGAAILRWRRLMRLGYAQWGCFYLADTCNVAIRRQLFLADHTRLGVADLRGGSPLRLASPWVRGRQVRLCMAPVAHVVEAPPAAWSDFLYRRRGRRSAQRAYPWRVRVALAAEPTLRVLVWLAALALLLWDGRALRYALGAVALRQGMIALLILLLRYRLHDGAWGGCAWLADLFMPLFALHPTGARRNVNKTARWR